MWPRYGAIDFLFDVQNPIESIGCVSTIAGVRIKVSKKEEESCCKREKTGFFQKFQGRNPDKRMEIRTESFLLVRGMFVNKKGSPAM